MPSTSEKMQRFFGAVLRYKTDKNIKVSEKVKKAANSMSLKQIKDMLKLKK